MNNYFINKRRAIGLITGGMLLSLAGCQTATTPAVTGATRLTAVGYQVPHTDRIMPSSAKVELAFSAPDRVGQVITRFVMNGGAYRRVEAATVQRRGQEITLTMTGECFVAYYKTWAAMLASKRPQKVTYAPANETAQAVYHLRPTGHGRYAVELNHTPWVFEKASTLARLTPPKQLYAAWRAAHVAEA
ncbi:hypothetical protein [Lacticaseibacillus daqingensis]|uniref:hypothetical protein n=1 Tax=Lacticaseibacillus daqingensis TaxID=2486014 RepID=UPI000F77BFEE|nr:hypothetical protein [Lacticaseibacillus daqingensis]